jgi:hypothetical protein
MIVHFTVQSPTHPHTKNIFAAIFLLLGSDLGDLSPACRDAPDIFTPIYKARLIVGFDSLNLKFTGKI